MEDERRREDSENGDTSKSNKKKTTEILYHYGVSDCDCITFVKTRPNSVISGSCVCVCAIRFITDTVDPEGLGLPLQDISFACQ